MLYLYEKSKISVKNIQQNQTIGYVYCMSNSWPISYSKLQYEMGQDFLDIQYTDTFNTTIQIGHKVDL